MKQSRLIRRSGLAPMMVLLGTAGCRLMGWSTEDLSDQSPTQPPKPPPTWPCVLDDHGKEVCRNISCGDGLCDMGEQCAACAIDCGVCSTSSVSYTHLTLPTSDLV